MFRYNSIIAALILSFPALCPGWTLVYTASSSSGTGAYWSVDGSPDNTAMQWASIPAPTASTRVYFCAEHQAISPAYNATSGALPYEIRTVPVIPSTATVRRLIGWNKVDNQQSISTLVTYPGGWPVYTISQPTAYASPRQYTTGHRVYGWFEGGLPTSARFITVNISPRVGSESWSGNIYGMKLTISDRNLYETEEPDVVAKPVVSGIGDPSITAQGQADKLKITSPIPASYTLNWNTAGMASFTVLGGTGAGQITSPITSGTSRNLTGVPASVQTYTLYTQSIATLAWQMSFPASWDILRDGVVQASGTNNAPTLGTAATGTYILRVNGIEKLAEDEVVSLTPAFLQRIKTVEVTIGNP